MMFRSLSRMAMPRNLNDGVHVALKEAMVNQRLPGGSRLDELKISAELGVSRTPVREAIQRLSAEGLVVIVPHRGAYVAQLSRKDVHELYEVREALEGQAARIAAARAPSGMVADLERTLRKYGDALGAGHEERLVQLDSRFHESIARASRNRRLMQLIRSHREHLKILRITSVSIPGRPGRSFHEMVAVLEALRARDADLAEDRMRRHIRSVRDDVLATSAEGGGGK